MKDGDNRSTRKLARGRERAREILKRGKRVRAEKRTKGRESANRREKSERQSR